MVPQEHMLRSLFHELVGDCYSQGAGVDDAEISTYVADLLTDFTENERIYSLRDEIGRPLRDLDAMLLAADPVNGTAASFDAERSARKQIGDYALFFAGMYPEAIGVSSKPISFERLVETGRDSYSIVAAFNLFEYAREARSLRAPLGEVRDLHLRPQPGAQGTRPPPGADPGQGQAAAVPHVRRPPLRAVHSASRAGMNARRNTPVTHL